MKKLNKDYFGKKIQLTLLSGQQFFGVVTDMISAADNPEDGVDALTMTVGEQDTYFPVTEIKVIKETD